MTKKISREMPTNKMELLHTEPTTKTVREDGRDAGNTIYHFYVDKNNKIIKIGDIVEIKSLIGGYGRTEVFTGDLLSVDRQGNFILSINGKEQSVHTKSNYDFNLSYKTNVDKEVFVHQTTTTHGWGAMDVHAHDTYVEILN